ncbi:MAG: hypothetical protein ACPW61_09305 [Methyloligella sp. ZOD6]
MLTLHSMRDTVLLAGLAFAFCLAFPAGEAEARDGLFGKQWSGDIGGYSTNRRQILGLDEMPPPPRDFGPHFDYQPYPLEGGVNKAPYMH